eukprot:CAMPEP_0181052390 /NCGR_PEP_ID=MMETSP1070-20121207/17565_1 /TAXON_ID=265543 /ORGANISM="Minutocellus polymorphus, Strain NH13" /LENGTH=273 /DNA_ID=CAMNT_0023131481 /DNA_START=49 /DNA_END=870 /DNA_ORIENTATION=+
MANVEELTTPVEVMYCGACGMPPEYCEYGPDFESHCDPWLCKTHPDIHSKLKALRGAVSKAGAAGSGDEDASDGEEGPAEPWTIEERLTAFYEKYQPDKVGDVPKLLEKYEGKYDKLFTALVKKYGPEPEDPYITANYAGDSDSDEDGAEGDMAGLSLEGKKDRKKRRGAAAKRVQKQDCRVIIQKVRRQRKKAVTHVVGMDTVPDVKLKDVSKEFRIKFAGSSSVKDTATGKEIIIQGDHVDAAAALIVKKFKVPADAVFLDIDGEFVPFAG